MLTDNIYQDMQDKILSLELKPGTALSFSNLTPLYHVSISPVRDALKRLASEGLVEIKPQSGTYVSLIDLSKVRDERFTRLYLELGAIEACARAGFGADLAHKIESLIEEQQKAFNCRSTSLFLSLDDQMHSLFFSQCNHDRVFENIKANSGNYHRIRMVSYLFDDMLQNALNQHKAILEAVKANDTQKVLSLERLHISKIENETADYQASYPQYFK